MKIHNVRRLIVLSGATVSDPTVDRSHISRSFSKLFVHIFIRAIIRDSQNAFDLIRQQAEDLDWTVVRPPILTEGRMKGVYRTADFIFLTPFNTICREDVADFILNQIDKEEFKHKAPMITY